MNPDNVPKTASNIHFGLFGYNYMPFGSKKDTIIFKLFKNKIFIDRDCVHVFER